MLRRRWETIRNRGRLPFTIAFTLVIMGIASEIALVACVLAWPIISHMPDWRILNITLAAAIFVFLIAPTIGISSSHAVWDWLDRQLMR